MPAAKQGRGGKPAASRPATLRLRAPAGCTSVSLAGHEFAVKDDVVAVPAELAAILVHAHGFAYED
ncbi:MAG TPA: hypothetical protein VGR79_04325 [Stellaceae bacterium]|nr:hypothetical protein [Stellaceae bacterium]